jgi:hypothetical protein
MRALTLALLVCVLAAPVAAQDRPASVESHAFRALGWAEQILSGVDLAQTVDAMARPGYAEANPFLRPIAGHPAALGFVKSAAPIGLNYWTAHLHRTKPRAAWVARVILVSFQAAVVIQNARTIGR